MTSSRHPFGDVHVDGWIVFLFNCLLYPFYFLIMKNKIECLERMFLLNYNSFSGQEKATRKKNNKNFQDVKLRHDKWPKFISHYIIRDYPVYILYCTFFDSLLIESLSRTCWFPFFLRIETIIKKVIIFLYTHGTIFSVKVLNAHIIIACV